MDPKPSKYTEAAKAAKKQRKKERLAREKLQKESTVSNESTISNEPLPIHPSRPTPRPPTNAPSGPRAMEERRNRFDIRSRVPASQPAASPIRWHPNTPLSLRPFLINSHQYYTFDEDGAEQESLARSQTFPAIEAIGQSLPAPIPNRLSHYLNSVEVSTNPSSRNFAAQVNLPVEVEHSQTNEEYGPSDLSFGRPPQDRPNRKSQSTTSTSTFSSVKGTPLAQDSQPYSFNPDETFSEDVIFIPTKAVRRALPVGYNVSLQVEEYPSHTAVPALMPTTVPATAAFNPPSQVEHSEAGQEGLFDPEPYLLDFGKYEGKTLAQVQEIDVTYITWLKDYQVSNRQPGLAEGLAAHAVSEEAKITRKQLRAAAAEYPITWGRYAGVALKDIPKAYRQWLIDDSTKSRPKVVEMLKLLGHRKKQPIATPIPSWWAPADMKSDVARSFLDDYNREDSLISPFDAFRFFGLPKPYLDSLPDSDGNHWLYQVYDLLATCEGKQRAEAALEDFLTHNNDREADGFKI